MDTVAATTLRATFQNRATFLAPGQRYAEAGTAPWRIDKQWTVVHVGLSGGAARVTSRCPNGHQLVVPAQQLEAAILAGQIVPVAGTGRIARC